MELEKATFEEIRDEYERRREAERVSLRDFLAGWLQNEGLEVVVKGRSGKGYDHYTSRGTIPEYNLATWKWVEVKDGKEFHCIVSLNMPDIAADTGTPVALYDRIGLVLSANPREWVYTNIDLPLVKKSKTGKENRSKQEQIARLILKHYEKHKKKRNI